MIIITKFLLDKYIHWTGFFVDNTLAMKYTSTAVLLGKVMQLLRLKFWLVHTYLIHVELARRILDRKK